MRRRLVPSWDVLQRPGLLLIIDSENPVAYHAVIEGWMEDDPASPIGTYPCCPEAGQLIGARGLRWIEGPSLAMQEVTRALLICERMCTACADVALDGDILTRAA